jgi:hypothetical protein
MISAACHCEEGGACFDEAIQKSFWIAVLSRAKDLLQSSRGPRDDGQFMQRTRPFQSKKSRLRFKSYLCKLASDSQDGKSGISSYPSLLLLPCITSHHASRSWHPGFSFYTLVLGEVEKSGTSTL